MSLRLIPKSVTLNDLERRNGRYTMRYFTEFGRFGDKNSLRWPDNGIRYHIKTTLASLSNHN